MPEDYQPSIDPDLVKALAKPETPDFAQMADDVVLGVVGDADLVLSLASALRQVWNARGKADVDVARRQLTNPFEDWPDDIYEAIRSLDR